MATTNEQLLALLTDQVLPQITAICTHLATLNGSVLHLKECEVEHTQAIAANAQGVRYNSETLARVTTVQDERQQYMAMLHRKENEVDDVRQEANHELLGLVRDTAKENRQATMANLVRVFDLAAKVAALAASVGLITKLANLW